jgi:hypothetical protein
MVYRKDLFNTKTECTSGEGQGINDARRGKEGHSDEKT